METAVVLDRIVHQHADQEDDTFLEVQEKATGEMTKYPLTVLTPSQLVREHHLIPPVPEQGEPHPSIPLEKLPRELQKVYQDIKNMIDEMNTDSLERRELYTMFGQYRSGEDIASTTIGRRPEGSRYGKDRVMVVYDPQEEKAVGLYFAAMIEHHPGRVEIGVMNRRSHRGKGFFTKVLEKDMKLTLPFEISEWNLQVSRGNENMLDICERLVRKRRFNATMIPFEKRRKEMTEAKRAESASIEDELPGEKGQNTKRIPTVTDQELYEYVHYVLTREADAALDGKQNQPGYSFYASCEYEILMNTHEEIYDNYWG
jgi:hypothetical protein